MNPLSSFVAANLALLTGRLRFPRGRIGDIVSLPEGTRGRVFRQAIYTPAGDPGQPRARFHVRFHVAGMSPRINILFSLLPIPFFAGLPGFRGKLWLLDGATGDFHGLYAWQTVADAEAYAHSFAMRFMTGRSVPGSVAYDITPLEGVDSRQFTVVSEKLSEPTRY
jgi:hypothetical protein